MKKLSFLFLSAALLFGCGAPTNPAQQKNSQNDTQEGVALLKSGDAAGAIKLFESAMVHNPQDPRPAYILGQIFMHMGRFDEAGQYFIKVISLDPSRGEAYLLLGGCFDLLGKEDEAIQSVKKSVEIFDQKKDERNLKESLIVLRHLVDAKNKPAAN